MCYVLLLNFTIAGDLTLLYGLKLHQQTKILLSKQLRITNFKYFFFFFFTFYRAPYVMIQFNFNFIYNYQLFWLHQAHVGLFIICSGFIKRMRLLFIILLQQAIFSVFSYYLYVRITSSSFSLVLAVFLEYFLGFGFLWFVLLVFFSRISCCSVPVSQWKKPRSVISTSDVSQSHEHFSIRRITARSHFDCYCNSYSISNWY